jgi:hypothetical protein
MEGVCNIPPSNNTRYYLQTNIMVSRCNNVIYYEKRNIKYYNSIISLIRSTNNRSKMWSWHFHGHLANFINREHLRTDHDDIVWMAS